MDKQIIKNFRCKSEKKKLIKTIKILGLGVLLFALLFIGSSSVYHSRNFMISGRVYATAYNSLPSQTDSTPWITASGTLCREGVIASNFLPLGTKVRIEGFGKKIFVVEDRMNKRYKERIDIWFRSYHDARKFGIREVKYFVVEST